MQPQTLKMNKNKAQRLKKNQQITRTKLKTDCISGSVTSNHYENK